MKPTIHILPGVLVVLTAYAAGQIPAPSPAPALKTLARQSLAKIDGEIVVPGLRDSIEVVRDRWGVPHIYAKNVDDLFFAQGYVMGQDRLWQLEMWRRQREGRLAEILGPRAFDRDRQTRLLMYRGPFDDSEWTSYHPDGKRVFTSFVNGLNAYIAQHAANLPVEFKLTGITPQPWKPETLLLRSATFGDAANEMNLARLVARVGPREANRIRMPDPWDELVVPEGLDVRSIGEDAVTATGRGAGAGAGGGRGTLPKPEIVAPYKAWLRATSDLLAEDANPDPGSNNWAVAGAKTSTGKPIVANDPHRDVTNPSLRYIVHLNAPGWNVIGAQEPPFVGVALGHNERVAWGLTITGTDQEDVFVEEVNPAAPHEVRYNGRWEPMRIVREEIPIKGEAPRAIELKFSRHGPIFFEDATNHRAYALKSVMAEPGTAAYLGGLRLAQASDCKEFLEAAMYWKAPTENLVCGDVDGNLTMQASALTPNRRGWVGRLPVPGSGKYEWNGFRSDLPRVINPQKGFIATANNNVNTPGLSPVMFKSVNNLAFERIARVEHALTTLLDARKFTIEDSQKLQHDYYSSRAAFDQDVFKGWTGTSPDVEKARAMVAGWDAMLSKQSAEAAIYITWRGVVDPKGIDFYRPIEERRPFAEAGLVKAIEKLTADQGSNWAEWRYGRLHRRDFPHPIAAEFDLPTVERGGGNGAVGADGASYREIMDVADWDRSVVTNVPGQSGQPESPYYGNLLPLWDKGEYFPMVYSRARVDREAAHRLMLKPPVSSSAQR